MAVDHAANAEYERRAAAAATTADAQRILREWRRREMLRIAWRDIAGHADVTETLRALSDLADALYPCRSGSGASAPAKPRSACRETRRGSEVPLIVLGMGKLGGAS